MLEKLATLYTLMRSFTIDLDKAHSLVFLKLIEETTAGSTLLALSSIVKANSDEFETAFIITSRGKDICVLYVADKEAIFTTYSQQFKELGDFLNSRSILLELITFNNFSKSEWIPF